jgi:hypothetical protein
MVCFINGVHVYVHVNTFLCEKYKQYSHVNKFLSQVYKTCQSGNLLLKVCISEANCAKHIEAFV